MSLENQIITNSSLVTNSNPFRTIFDYHVLISIEDYPKIVYSERKKVLYKTDKI